MSCRIWMDWMPRKSCRIWIWNREVRTSCIHGLRVFLYLFLITIGVTAWYVVGDLLPCLPSLVTTNPLNPKIINFYCSTRKEAITIMGEAKNLGLTGKSYVWIATQAVIGATLDAPEEFPIGNFLNDVTSESLFLGSFISCLIFKFSKSSVIMLPITLNFKNLLTACLKLL